ncbi:peroxidase 1-like [Oryza brachyantha]|uniref:peroxidase 1-like n=1 Tax=Oryza brachyantha TaxID=4533 RepID=UPI001ADABC7A|nr:peroxidase 1-like [Oryza brachyantha]
MASSNWLALAMAVAVAVASTLPAASRAQLQVGFYNTSCPRAEALVRQAVAAAVANNSGLAAGLIRLHFHDCFVRGCDASVLIFSPNGTAERDAPPNNPSLRGFEVVDAAKAAVEAACPGTVSCADILAFAARDSVNLTGNTFYQVPAGRRDGRISNFNDAFTLPNPNATATELVDGFRNRSLTAEEMVILSGSHTIGRSHCSSFINRNSERLANGTISPAYQALLEALCAANTSTPVTTAIDLSTPATLDNNYYKLLPLNLGLFFSDDQLIRNATLLPFVNAFTANETLWKEKFAAAMIKMGNIDVLTGTQGEIRLNCSTVNAPSSSASAGTMIIDTVFPDADGGEVAAS